MERADQRGVVDGSYKTTVTLAGKRGRSSNPQVIRLQTEGGKNSERTRSPSWEGEGEQ